MRMKNIFTIAVVLGLMSFGKFAFAENWNSKLIYAVKEGDLEGVKAALAKGEDVNAKDNDGQTALMLAAKNSHKDVAELLISKGAEINARANDGKTALTLALENGKTDVAAYLRSVGGKE